MIRFYSQKCEKWSISAHLSPFRLQLWPSGMYGKFEKYPKVYKMGPDVATSQSFGILDWFSTLF